ncbi:elongator complex protein 1 isoform X2 [Malania oleifera]|uniref:elongator complex protein 1 isoform X2 n=1 Tax=Malania oleifera TaxID=397392 RepID=UPI0025ADA896|nr:elongator complex protein 1 isoform X2 [Malania oleifera]
MKLLLRIFLKKLTYVNQLVPPNNSFETSISWRGDGKYFATLSGVSNHSSMHKKLKVWERDSGVLHAASDSKIFMGNAFDWMPSGAKIAAVYDRKTENKSPLVVFFERNGLERSSFSINESTAATIEILKWNCNSDLLAAVSRCDKYDSVMIWLFSNNHWYLKQEIRYSKDDGVRFMWDPTKPLQLICWTVGGHITIYNFVWVSAVMENSTALVIDSSQILVTPLSLSLMPPPMYIFSLKFSSAIRCIAFCTENSKNRLAAYLSNGCLSVVELPPHDTWEELEGKEFSVETCYSEVAFRSFTHISWLDPHILLGFSQCGSSHSNYLSKISSCKEGSGGYYLQEIEFMCSEDYVPGLPTCSGWDAKISYQISLEELVIGIASNPAKRYSAFIQLDGGKIVEYSSKLGISVGSPGPNLRKCDDMGFSSLCPWMSAVSVSDNGPLKPLLFGLDDVSRLHVNGRTLCNNCSSFSLYSNSDDQVITHLILATKQDLLFIVDVIDILHGHLEGYGNFIHAVNKRREEENKKFINIWERGAKIVGVLHGDEASVIIQTSRGNLECIYPRKLVLASIVNALVQGRFNDALLMVRRHRIDFNIIVDHYGWKAFLQSASEFVKQVNNLSYITEFVCSIKNENVAETLYKNYISPPCPREAHLVDSDADNKVSSILLAIRKALEEQLLESPARELCILTTLARSSPPALEEALERVKVIRDMELLGSDEPRRTSYPSAEEALKHLLWLSDAEGVYESALGLYDLNLAAIVALNSQRDPKEFLPFLQELERMPPVLMRYNVDLRLRRYESALKNIASAGDAYYADCLSLMEDNPQLFPLGLQLFTDPAKRRQVLEAWGDHLSGEKCFEDAATTYLSCFCLGKALKAYRACGHWSGVLTVAGLLKLGKEEILQLAHELCEEVQALGKPAEAAKIALDYCGDCNNGIGLLISARDWEEALRVGFLNRKDELISEVKNASLECAGLLLGEYAEGLEKVGKYLTRYLAVRQRRLLLAAKVQSDNQSINDLDDDTASETSSNFSGMSAYTLGTRKSSATSVNSRTASKARDTRRQRNRGKIRAGSPGEELALVEHLKGMSLTTGARSELKSLLTALLMLGEEEIARKLQRAGESFQLSQMAAVKLAEEMVSTDNIDEHAHTLEHYIQKVRSEPQNADAFFWRSKVLLSP